MSIRATSFGYMTPRGFKPNTRLSVEIKRHKAAVEAEQARRWLLYRLSVQPIDPLASISWSRRAAMEAECDRAAEAAWRERLDSFAGRERPAAPAIPSAPEPQPAPSAPRPAMVYRSRRGIVI